MVTSGNNANDDENNEITVLIQRLLCIFSDTSYEWTRKQLQTNSESFSLDSLLKLLEISTDKQLIKAVQSRSCKEFLVFDEDTESIRRLIPFDFNTSPFGPAFVVTEKNDESKIEVCLCCYGDYQQSNLKECATGSGHFVCDSCISMTLTNQIGAGRFTVKCIGDADCKQEYSLALLDKVLTPELSKLLNDNVFHEMVKDEGIDNAWTCPTCAHIGFIEGSFSWIDCPECKTRHCAKCNNIFHGNKTCEEAQMEEAGLKSPEHRAHEAMSRAVKRVCPHCDQEYVKGDGCNAIRCNCGKLSCYLCGQKIENHSHFGRDKCEMFTSKKAMEEMNEKKRMEAGRKVLAEAGITDEEKIRSILASPPKDNLGQKKAAIPARFLPPAPLVVARPRQRQLEAPDISRLNEQMEQIQELGFRAARARRNARREGRRGQPVRADDELPRLAERLEQIRVDLEARRHARREEEAPAAALPGNNVLAGDLQQRPDDDFIRGIDPNTALGRYRLRKQRQQERRVDIIPARRLRDDVMAPAEPVNVTEQAAVHQPQRQHEVGWWHIPFRVFVAFCLGIAIYNEFKALIDTLSYSVTTEVWFNDILLLHSRR